jgi:hypothetical protein
VATVPLKHDDADVDADAKPADVDANNQTKSDLAEIAVAVQQADDRFVLKEMGIDTEKVHTDFRSLSQCRCEH